LWNGTDPILKERAFGLTGPQGNHGEDVKEHWWSLDALPSHATQAATGLPRCITRKPIPATRDRPALAAVPAPREALGADFDRVVARRSAEADEFYAGLTPAGTTADEAMIMRQACAGMLWSKQPYYYDVARWLDGDPAQPPPAAARKTGRNSRWRNLDLHARAGRPAALLRRNRPAAG
jgi:hypothetical protein